MMQIWHEEVLSCARLRGAPYGSVRLTRFGSLSSERGQGGRRDERVARFVAVEFSVDRYLETMYAPASLAFMRGVASVIERARGGQRPPHSAPHTCLVVAKERFKKRGGERSYEEQRERRDTHDLTSRRIYYGPFTSGLNAGLAEPEPEPD